MEPSKLKRLIGFDYIRGLSCLLVILYHYTARYEELFGFDIKPVLTFKMGYMGVATFFILSGYLTIYNIDEKISVKKYLQKKFLRLYPCYWLCLFITFIVTRMALPERAVSPIEALLNMTMLQSFFGIKLVDGAYWTLACELLFYIFVLISVVIMKKKSIMPLICFLLLSLLVISDFFDYQYLFRILNRFLIDGYGYMFMSGMMIYYINLNSYRFCAFITILMCLVVQYFSHNFTYFVFFSVNIIVVILLATGRIEISNEKSFVTKLLQPFFFVSNISYALYLLHQNIGYAIILKLLIITNDVDASILVTIVSVSFMSYIVDALVCKIVRHINYKTYVH